MNPKIIMQLLKALRNTNTINPLIVCGHGTLGSQWVATVYYLIQMAFGDLAEKLPVAFVPTTPPGIPKITSSRSRASSLTPRRRGCSAHSSRFR